MAVKNFADGDVLYGPDINGLVQASNMLFPTAAARAAALTGGMAPSTGAMSTLQDDQITYRYNAAGSWAPAPGTVLFARATGNAQSIPYATPTPVKSFDVDLIGRNYGNWFDPIATGKFLPTVAGYYEFVGGIPFYHDTSNTNNVRQVFLMFNSNNTRYARSVASGVTSACVNMPFYQTLPPTTIYMNGTTDYVYLGAYQGATAGVPLYVSYASDQYSYFSAKYLGA